MILGPNEEMYYIGFNRTDVNSLFGQDSEVIILCDNKKLIVKNDVRTTIKIYQNKSLREDSSITVVYDIDKLTYSEMIFKIEPKGIYFHTFRKISQENQDMHNRRVEPSYYKPFHISWINESMKVSDYLKSDLNSNNLEIDSIQPIESKSSQKHKLSSKK